MTTPELLDTDGVPVPYLEGRWLVEENQRYELRLGKCEASLNQKSLEWQPTIPGFVLYLPMAAGGYHVEIRDGVVIRSFNIEVEPAATKLSPSNWEAMLSDLDGWIPDLLVGAEGATTGGVSAVGLSSPLVTVALIPLLGSLERALRVVIASPRTLDISFLEDVPLHQTRSANRESLAWLSRHPNAAQWLDSKNEQGLAGPPPFIPQRVVEDSYDHPANRHIAWMIGRVSLRLRHVAQVLESITANELTDTRSWVLPRAQVLRSGASRLERLVKHSFLGRIKSGPASEAGLLVVQDHPAYARVHQLGRRFLSSLFSLDSVGPSAPTRPSFELYELWTFLATWRALAAEIPALKWKQVNLPKLLAHTSGVGGARISAPWRGGLLAIDFNPTFRSALKAVPSHGRFSISSERRPDVIVSF